MGLSYANLSNAYKGRGLLLKERSDKFTDSYLDYLNTDEVQNSINDNVRTQFLEFGQQYATYTDDVSFKLINDGRRDQAAGEQFYKSQTALDVPKKYEAKELTTEELYKQYHDKNFKTRTYDEFATDVGRQRDLMFLNSTKRLLKVQKGKKEDYEKKLGKFDAKLRLGQSLSPAEQVWYGRHKNKNESWRDEPARGVSDTRISSLEEMIEKQETAYNTKYPEYSLEPKVGDPLDQPEVTQTELDASMETGVNPYIQYEKPLYSQTAGGDEDLFTYNEIIDPFGVEVKYNDKDFKQLDENAASTVTKNNKIAYESLQGENKITGSYKQEDNQVDEANTPTFMSQDEFDVYMEEVESQRERAGVSDLYKTVGKGNYDSALAAVGLFGAYKSATAPLPLSSRL